MAVVFSCALPLPRYLFPFDCLCGYRRETHRKDVRNKSKATLKLLPETFADDSNFHSFNDSQCLCLPCLMPWGIFWKVLLQLLRSVFSSKFTAKESE